MIAASPRGARWRAAGLFLAMLLAGCATPPSDPAERAQFEQANDPLEPLNRKILDLNLLIDRILLKPVAKVYIAVLPQQGRDAFKRALDNMKEPVVVINNVLQGAPDRAGIAAGRFLVNSTLGIAGLLDQAGAWGLKKETGDFGQTLFAWGLPGGPYLVVPLLGPANPRDLFGMGIDSYIDPFSYLATVKDLDDLQIGRFVADGIDQRARAMDVLDDLEKNSLDFYAQLRSLSQQNRAAELRHGKAAEPAANFYQDPGQDPGQNPGKSPALPASAPTPLPAPVPPPASSAPSSRP